MSFSALRSLHVTEDPARRLVRVRLDHGKANEMGREQIAEWERLARVLADHPATTVITSSARRSARGTPIFVAGANITERQGWTDAQIREHVRWQRATLAAIRHIPQFHVALVDGLALGWGTELLLACDYRIATPQAGFALPETGLGIVPGAGGTATLSQAVGLAQALRLGITGERIDSEEALRIGLIQELLPDAPAALGRALKLAEQAAHRSPTAMAAFKASVLAASPDLTPEALAHEAHAYDHCVDSGQAALGREHFKRILAREAVDWGPRRPLPKAR